MKHYLLGVLFFFCLLQAKADHISGSELIYQYIGPGTAAGSQKYMFTYRLFRGCNSSSPSVSSEVVTLGIYPTDSKILYTQLRLTYQSTLDISLNTAVIKCFTGNIAACYGVGIFTGTLDLPATPDGFTAAWIRCCRPMDISNIPTYEIGINPVATIPGTRILPAVQHNTSAEFRMNDTALVCAGKRFQIDFSATDRDGDSLSYRLTNGNNWNTQFEYNPPPLTQLAYTTVPYRNGFSATNPTGTSPVLDPLTGIVTGIAPAAGRYLFCIAVDEWRNGVKINEHVKEIPVTVGNCDFVEALLPAKIISCNSDIVSFENSSTSSSIASYRWIFDTLHPANNISLLPTPTHQYSDTGTYSVRLVVTGTTGCKDSITSQVLIYPGLKAGFSTAGNCIRYPFIFTDTSSTKGSAIVKWRWTYGEAMNNSSTAFAPVSHYTFSTAGSKTIKLFVESEKGCTDSTNKQIVVTDKPTIHLAFRDTTICRTDTIQLAETSGYNNYAWTSSLPVNDATHAAIKISPVQSGKYFVNTTANNCDNIDSVTVSVLPKDNVVAGKDTITCAGDTVPLTAISAATNVAWSGDAGILNATSLSARAFPMQTTRYIITTNPGRCALRDTLVVTAIPYPRVTLPQDAVICMGEKIMLRAQVHATYFTWSPVNTLSDPTILSPYAAPSKKTNYSLTVSDTLGCPKTVSDTIEVSVTPLFTINAGNDTAVVGGQPLQLNATASDLSVNQFVWTPVTGLNNSLTANPIATLPAGIDSIQYKVTGYNGNCHAEDYIIIKKYAGGSDFYIPTAFTPNGDGLNDVFKVRAAGIANVEFIRIYNRPGQLVFQSADISKGWNGSYKGVLQPSGTFIYWIKGTSFAGETIERKGTLVLIR